MIKKNIHCKDCNNTTCLIKKSCSNKVLEKVNAEKIINYVKKRQTVFHEDNDSYYIFFIQSGLVKVYKNGAFNKDQIVRFSYDGNILGHRGFIHTETYPVSAETIKDSHICCFQKSYFLELLKEVPEMAINLMLCFANELNEEETKLRDMAVLNVREKVVKGLLQLINSFGLNSSNEINYISLLSRQDIANFVGLTPNQITKELTSLKKENIIDVYQKNIKVISIKHLKEIVSFIDY